MRSAKQPSVQGATAEFGALGIAAPWLRVAAVALAALITAALVAALGQPFAFPPSSLLAALYLIPVNLVTLVLLHRALHRRGSGLRAALGYRRERLGRDLAWGLLWLVVLWIPFVAAVMLTMLALYGAETMAAFETVFVPAGPQPDFGGMAGIVLGVIVVLLFAPINAPAEELVYRGLGQDGLRRHGVPLVLAILLPSIAFGLQHIVFAPTAEAALVYFVAFLAWGIGSGIIYRRQGRLMPLVLAHVIVNLVTSAPALVFPILQLTGVIP